MCSPRLLEERFHTDHAKTVGTVQYLSQKYRGKMMLRIDIGESKRTCVIVLRLFCYHL